MGRSEAAKRIARGQSNQWRALRDALGREHPDAIAAHVAAGAAWDAWNRVRGPREAARAWSVDSVRGNIPRRSVEDK